MVTQWNQPEGQNPVSYCHCDEVRLRRTTKQSDLPTRHSRPDRGSRTYKIVILSKAKNPYFLPLSFPRKRESRNLLLSLRGSPPQADDVAILVFTLCLIPVLKINCHSRGSGNLEISYCHYEEVRLRRTTKQSDLPTRHSRPDRESSPCYLVILA